MNERTHGPDPTGATSRRRFLAQTVTGAATAAVTTAGTTAATTAEILASSSVLQASPRASPAAARTPPARDPETYWESIAARYDPLESHLNLIAGANNPNPIAVIQRLAESQASISRSPLTRGRGPAMRKEIEGVRDQIARVCSADPEEIGLTRGTTEGMNIFLAGVPLAPGDEILTTRHEYGSIQDAIRQRARRDGISVRELDWKPRVERGEDLVELFAANVSPKTRLIVVCHIYGGYKQIMPIRAIAELARSRGITLAVDGALAFGNIDVNFAELNCDLYATSMHKWLGGAIGTGFIYVRKDRIADVTPLFGTPDPDSGDIRKFEDVGSSSPSPFLASGAALDLLEQIGPKRKYERLQYLKNYWVDQLRDLDGFEPMVRIEPEYSGGALSFRIANLPPRELWIHLQRRKRIYIGVHPLWEKEGFIQCNYIAPNVFILPRDLDRIVEELRHLSRRGGLEP